MARVYTVMASPQAGGREELAPRAKETAERAWQLAPNSFESHRAMGTYYRWIGRDRDLAQQHYREALELRPNDSGILTEVGIGAGPESRVAYLRQALQLDPFNRDALEFLGVTYWRLGQLEEADRYFDLWIRRIPEGPWGYFRKTMLYLTMGDVATAGAVLRLMPKHVDLLALLLATWDFDDRMVLRLFAEEFSEALDRRSLHDPGDSVAYYFAKADHARFRERPDLAEVYYDSARVVLEGRRQRSSDTRTVLNLASVYSAVGRHDLAVLAAQQSSALTPPGLVLAYLTRAETYVLAGEYDKAVDEIAHVLDDGSVYFGVPLLQVDPLWAPLRGHPRYQELVGRGDVGR